MGQIKVVLIFNEDDERQREAGEYLKTKKRCKTALVTELVQAWMKNGETGAGTSASTVSIEAIKKQLLQDKEFLSEIEKSMVVQVSEKLKNQSQKIVIIWIWMKI